MACYKYTCRNFEKEAENEKLLQVVCCVIMIRCRSGEFAIGTNTTAYMVARRYEINDKLPVLIAERPAPLLQWVIPATAMKKTA